MKGLLNLISDYWQQILLGLFLIALGAWIQEDNLKKLDQYEKQTGRMVNVEALPYDIGDNSNRSLELDDLP